ncbi:MAG: hypothetical protein BMS9Abin10_1015 [Gammaproteobacteria bacterium]|nr:MAG: hypothetical protein BMS9Abin10_1015 [Gammaproteobacteria bacterium]
MKAIITLTLAVFGLVAVANLPVQAAPKDKEMKADVQEAIAAFKKKDPTIKSFFKTSYGYVVFPSIAKGGFIIGGAGGKGLVFKKDTVIGGASVSQGSIGLQAGGQTFREIIFFKDSTALNKFTAGKFAFDAQVNAVGADAGVAAKTNYSKGVAVFTVAKGGLMFEASVGGQKFKFKPKK